jgi:lysine 2,3-aminomutase
VIEAPGTPDRGHDRTIHYRHELDELERLEPQERAQLRPVVARHAFRANDYYLGLIDWDDPRDPIRRLIVPLAEELDGWGRLDPSAEALVTVARGVQHKYPHTVLLLCNESCGGHCRYCFRKRIFMEGSADISLDVSEGLAYIARHPEVTNVLLTGGDPLRLSTPRLVSIMEALAAIPHVGIIRIGTKMPAFNPWRILGDPDLLEAIRANSGLRRRIYVITHFDHPRELTRPATEAVAALLDAGAICANQCPLIRGINDRPDALVELFRELSFMGCPPYYVFQCRPTVGNKPYAVPITEAFGIFDEARKDVSGLAKRARFVLSHETGKIEVLAVDAERIYMRYHRARDPEQEGRFLVFRRDDQAYWLDDLQPFEERLQSPIAPETEYLVTAGPE